MEHEADIRIIEADRIVIVQRSAVARCRNGIPIIGFLLRDDRTRLEVDRLSGRIPQYGIHHFIFEVVSAGAIHIICAARREKCERNQNIS